MSRRLLCLLPCLAIVACTELPPLDRTVDAAAKDAPYPNLVPTHLLLTGIAEPRIEDETEADLAARGDRLRARAAALRRRNAGY